MFVYRRVLGEIILTQEQVFGGPHTVKLFQTELVFQLFGPQFTVTSHVGKGNKFCMAGLGDSPK